MHLIKQILKLKSEGIIIMILDEVLNKNAIFNQDDMIDIFVEGFLYALSM
jgi:hypothetical protein